MNIISCDVLKAYRFYTRVNSIQPNPGCPGSVKFIAQSRYNHVGDYMSDVCSYTYMPNNLLKIKEWIGNTKRQIDNTENRLYPMPPLEVEY